MTDLNREDAKARWDSYTHGLRASVLSIPRLKDQNVLSQLNSVLLTDIIAAGIFTGLFLLITIVCFMYAKGNEKAGALVGTGLFFLLIGVIPLGFAVIYRFVYLVKDNDKKFDEYNIQEIWNTYPDIIQDNKIYMYDGSYGSTDDIRLHL
jgi:hypothetical protein